MPTIAALSVGREAQKLVTEQLAAYARVRTCHTVDELLAVVAGDHVDAVVSDLHDWTGVSVVPMLPTLRSKAPQVPVVLCFEPTVWGLRELERALAVEVPAAFATRAQEHVGLAVRSMLKPPVQLGPTEALLRQVVLPVPRTVQAYFAVCAVEAVPSLSVERAAKVSRLALRTLERRLKLARLPTATAVLKTFTALHAAWWLDVHGLTTKQVVARMGLSSASSLTKLLQHYCGCTPRSLDEIGGFGGLVGHFGSIVRRAGGAGKEPWGLFGAVP